MTGFKKGTGSLNFEEDTDQDEPSEAHEQEQDQEHEEDEGLVQATQQEQEPERGQPQAHDVDAEPPAEPATASGSSSTADASPSSPKVDMENLPYLVQRQMRGASVNADRTNQLLLEVRHFVKENEDTFLDDLQDLVNGPVYKGDAREAAMIVAHENPELVADKLREWGIEYLDK